jgi:hypothetical protein
MGRHPYAVGATLEPRVARLVGIPSNRDFNDLERLTSVSAPVESKGLSSAVANPRPYDRRVKPQDPERQSPRRAGRRERGRSQEHFGTVLTTSKLALPYARASCRTWCRGRLLRRAAGGLLRRRLAADR